MSRNGLNRTGNKQYRRYLRSQQWGFRRVRWFRDCRARGYEPACQGCGVTPVEGDSLALHHGSYEGGPWDAPTQQWVAREAHEDLVAMSREHDQQHQRVME